MASARDIASRPRRRPHPLLTGGSSLLVGAGVTLALFSGMAHFENVQAPQAPEEIEDLRVISVPVDVPPPRPTEHAEAVADTTSPLANIQIGASESPVKIAVVPPDLAMLYPPETSAPPAHVEVTNLFTDLKPRTAMPVDSKRIYQQSEVDQAPTVLRRVAPHIPSWIRKDADVLRVTLVIVADTTGSVASVRLMRPSGNDGVDKILLESVRTQWLFTPAIKNGKKVRCLFQQTITIKWSDASPFGY